MSYVEGKNVGHYVSIVNGDEQQLLLGPYPLRREAEQHIRRAKAITRVVNDRAAFAAYGTARVTVAPAGMLPDGKLNYLLDPREAAARSIRGYDPARLTLPGLDTRTSAQVFFPLNRALESVDVREGEARVVNVGRHSRVAATAGMSFEEALRIREAIVASRGGETVVLTRHASKRSVWETETDTPIVVPDGAIAYNPALGEPRRLAVPKDLDIRGQEVVRPVEVGSIVSLEVRGSGRRAYVPLRVTDVTAIAGETGMRIATVDARGHETTHRVDDSGFSDEIRPLTTARYNATHFPSRYVRRDEAGEVVGEQPAEIDLFDAAVDQLVASAPREVVSEPTRSFGLRL